VDPVAERYGLFRTQVFDRRDIEIVKKKQNEKKSAHRKEKRP